MLEFLAAAILQIAAGTPVIEQASPEDCAIIAEIGKSQAKWGKNGPYNPKDVK
jgi:hypothetical protein